MKNFHRASVAVAAAAAAGLMLAACSTSPAPTPAPTTPAPTSSAPAVGTSPGTWAPLELGIADSGSTVEMVSGQAATLVGLPAATGEYVLESSDPAIVTVSQASDSGGVVTVPGFTAVMPGTATVTLFDRDAADSGAQPIMVVTVVVDGGNAMGASPGTWTPLALTLADEGKTIDMVVGQTANFTDLPAGKYTLESSDPSIVAVEQASNSGGVTTVPGLTAKKPGTVTVTLFDGSPATPVMVITVTVK